MPPFLFNGRAVNLRKRSTGKLSFFCQCQECVRQVYYDEKQNTVLYGQWLPKSMYRQHMGEENRRKIAEHNFYAAASSMGQSVSYQEVALDSRTKKFAMGNVVIEDSVAEPPDFRPTSASRRVHREKRVSHRNRPLQRKSTLTLELEKIRDSLRIITASSFVDTFERKPLMFTHTLTGKKLIDIPTAEFHEFHLDREHSFNYAFLQYETDLEHARQYMQSAGRRISAGRDSLRIKSLLPRVNEELAQLENIKQEAWVLQRDLAQREQHRHVKPGKRFYMRAMEPISGLIYLFTSVLYLLANLSQADLNDFVIPSLLLLVRLLLTDSSNPERLMIGPSVPGDVRTIVKALCVDPMTKSMVCCPACFATYAFDENNPQTYPQFCTFTRTRRAKPCGRRLKKVSPLDKVTPTRQFVYQDFRHWIARLYARPDIEKYLDNLPTPLDGQSEMKDMWDGSVLRGFTGPDGRLFMDEDRPNGEGRLIFGLNMDGFNPYGNKEAGKKVSICGIYMVCLNLPIAIRYKVENVFLLGIVPGPTEPSTYEVNHLLRPLVDDLLVTWHSGIYLTNTPKYPLGRSVRCALVPLICDLPSARRVAGLGGHAAGHFCSECLQTLDNINNLDTETWSRRTYAEHCKHATAWRDASSDAQRLREFHKYGAKWSELLRLPYWDPTKFVVIDSMHGFYLRLFQRHIRDIWGMNIKLDDGSGNPDLNLTEDEITHAQDILNEGTVQDLQRLKRQQLRYLCRDLGYHYGGKKGALVKILVKHRDNLLSSTPEGEITGHVEHLHETETSTMRQSRDSNHNQFSEQSIQDIDELEILFHQAKSKIDAAKRETLLALCLRKLPGTEDYSQSNKKALAQLIHDFRRTSGITNGKDKVIHKIKKKPLSSLSGLDTPVISVTYASTASPSAFSSPNFMASDTLPNVSLQTSTSKDMPPSSSNEPSSSTEPGKPSENDLSSFYRQGSKTAYQNAKTTFLAALCAVKFGNMISYDSFERDKIDELLYEARLADGIIDGDGELIQDDNRKTNVIGKQTLKIIREDMEKTILPSWFSSAPKHPGEVKWGKLTADEWKAFCIVNLPVTLGRLWGHKPKTHRHYKMLENFMHLVTAVKIANMRVISNADISLYEKHMKTYLAGVIELYPFTNISPYQHLSLHFPEHLRRFGPTHSWRCFAFERYNGIIQGIPTNNKFGQMEQSKFLRFCRMQNLRTMFSDKTLPPELQPLNQAFEKRYMFNVSGTLNEELGPNAVTHGQKIHSKSNDKNIRLVCEWLRNQEVGKGTPILQLIQASNIVASCERHGQKFQPGNIGNGHVIIRHQDTLQPANIAAILTHFAPESRHPETYMIVRKFRNLSDKDAAHDSYRFLPQAAGYTVYEELEGTMIVVSLSDVISHFAATPLILENIERPCLHVQPLRL